MQFDRVKTTLLIAAAGILFVTVLVIGGRRAEELRPIPVTQEGQLGELPRIPTEPSPHLEFEEGPVAWGPTWVASPPPEVGSARLDGFLFPRYETEALALVMASQVDDDVFYGYDDRTMKMANQAVIDQGTCKAGCMPACARLYAQQLHDLHLAYPKVYPTRSCQ